MIEAEKENPTAYHVGFAFNYDVNMILKDLPRSRLERLRQEKSIRWGQYRIEWYPSKWFQVSKGAKGERVTCRIWDVWGFFQSSFVVALRAYLGKRDDISRVESGKERRGDFAENEMAYIQEYWETELDLLVLLCNRLRSYLYSAGLFVTQWHGPGAIASYALNRERIQAHKSICPDSVNDAAQYAYAGGRFELFKLGRHEGKCFQYDIRSAYPEAISQLPSLANGRWERTRDFHPDKRFAVYKIRMIGPLMDATVPYPLFYRDKAHCIHYPPIVEGWYWAPEVSNIYKWGAVEILDGWVFHDDGTYPFAWVADVYRTRQQWKKDGNPCEKALKLLLNSLYGKMAQRVGWDKKNGKAPKWHQLEWAGWVTSYTRAKLYRAMMEAGTDLIGVETDAVFSTRKLALDIGTGLGQWEESIYDEILYLQSGFYFAREGETWKTKYRGFDKGSIDLNEVVRYLQTIQFDGMHIAPAFVGTTTRFVGMGAALMSKDASRWRVWETTERELRIGADGKRVHVFPFCHACRYNKSPYSMFHNLSVSKPHGGISYPHEIPWKIPLSPEKEQWDKLKHLDLEAIRD